MVPAGYTVLLANIPLLALSYRRSNKRFTIFSMIGTVSLSLFLILTKNFNSIITIHDALLLCVYGGVFSGVGAGLAYSNHGSEGGMNIVVMLIKKKYDNFDVGQLGFFVNCFYSIFRNITKWNNYCIIYINEYVYSVFCYR